MKLTTEYLRTMIIEEMRKKFGKPKSTEDAAKETKEVSADELADTVEKKIDYVKALKIEESRLIKRLSQIKKEKQKIVEGI